MENKLEKKEKALPNNELSMVFQVSDRVKLNLVRVLECNAKLISFPKDGANEFEITANTRFQIDKEGKALFVFVTLTLYSVTNESEELAKIKSEYLLMYELNNWEDLTDEHFAHFANHNGVFNAWPYWREMVQSMLARLQLPVLTLSTHRFGYVLPKEPSITKQKVTKKKVVAKSTGKSTKRKPSKKTSKRKVVAKK